MSARVIPLRSALSAAARPVSFWERIRHVAALSRQRRNLAELEDHLLCDIGVTRAEAEAEAARPVWDAPASWLR